MALHARRDRSAVADQVRRQIARLHLLERRLEAAKQHVTRREIDMLALVGTADDISEKISNEEAFTDLPPVGEDEASDELDQTLMGEDELDQTLVGEDELDQTLMGEDETSATDLSSEDSSESQVIDEGQVTESQSSTEEIEEQNSKSFSTELETLKLSLLQKLARANSK